MKKKFISLIISFIILQIFVINKSFAKSLPPGSGAGDIPANVLILIDKSGSMGWSMNLGADLSLPNKIALGSDSDKNVITIPSTASTGIRNVSYSNALKAIGSSTKFTKDGQCDSQSNQVFVEHYQNDIIYFSKDGEGCRVNIETGLATRFAKHPSNRVLGGDLKNNFLYVYKGAWEVLIYDLDNNNQLHKTCDIGGGSDLGKALAGIQSFEHSSLKIDKSSSYLFSMYSDPTNSSRTLVKKFPLSSGLGSCPSLTASSSTTLIKDMRLTRDVEIHPTKNDTFLITRLDRIYEWDASANTWGTGGSNGIGGFRSNFTGYNPSSISQIRFNRAYGIAVDEDNERIYVADRNGNKIQVFDKDFGFIKILGKTGQSGSRWAAATNAIKDVVRDSNLTSGAHFGFGYWASSVEVWFTSWSGFGWQKCRDQKARINDEIGITNSHWLYTPRSGGGYYCQVREKPVGYTNWNDTTENGEPCNPAWGCLLVKVDREGASKTVVEVNQVSPGGGTRAEDFTTIASQYFNHADSPKTDVECATNYVIVIGDGDWGRHAAALTAATALKNDDIKTYAIAFGPGITDSGMLNFDELGAAGGTDRVQIASDGNMLKEVLSDIIGNIIGDRVSFTAPSITAKVDEGGTLLQAQFQYVKRQEWNGYIKKTKLNEFGVPIDDHPSNWQADEKIPTPDNRKIWTHLELSNDYTSGYNNVVDTNANELRAMFQRFNGQILDYHRDTAGIGGGDTTRCSPQVSSIEDGDEDDLKGLINFLRGEDYFDYDGDCNLTNTREHYLGDVYNSDILVVGKPSAEDKFTSNNQEAYWRAKNDYSTFASTHAERKETIYVGANDGMLHAFDFEFGNEVWAFIPPFLMPELAGLINPNFNVSTPAPAGGTNAKFGVDGSPVQHDIFMRGINIEGDREAVRSWRTILMVPYGRGGAGFSVLDVTNRDTPLHYFSVYNDKKTNTIYRMDHTGKVSEQSYLPQSFDLAQFPEAMATADRHQADPDNISTTCDGSKETSCHKALAWTLPDVFSGSGVKKSDLELTIDSNNISSFNIGTDANGNPTIIFSTEEIYFQVASGAGIIPGQSVGIKIKPSSSLTSAAGDPDYDYSKLGETWSSPRILRMPNSGRGDTNIDDDIYVAVMGAGFGSEFSGVGSGVFVINLQDTVKPYKIEKYVEIEDWQPESDNSKNEIINSVPGSLVVISADNARNYTNYRGALVYINDYEGKISKLNLTNLEGDGTIELYDIYTMFNAKADQENRRFMFHSMDATIGKYSKKLWLFAGTGDMNDLTNKSTDIENVLLGIVDKDFPNYVNPAPGSTSDLKSLNICHNTTDQISPTCAGIDFNNNKMGWYITLPNAKKVTADPTVAGGIVYFPVYKPPANICDLGPATICAVDDECGTNLSSGLGKNDNDDECHYVGKGILSKIVAFGGKLYANIAGEAADGKDLITKSAIGVEIEVGRNGWRQQ